MRKFVAGGVVAIIILALIALMWFSLDEQAKGVIVGLILGGVGMLVGIALALAVVAIFLLYQLRWQVQGSQASPMFPPGTAPPLALPPGQAEFNYYPPPRRPEWARPGRDWQVLGEEDMPRDE